MQVTKIVAMIPSDIAPIDVRIRASSIRLAGRPATKRKIGCLGATICALRHFRTIEVRRRNAATIESSSISRDRDL
jgi:hypothetical protein